MLTKPRDCLFEVYVFGIYKQILEHVQGTLENNTSLEKDQELLAEEINWNVKMAIVYRVERKKIIRSQLNLIEKVLAELKSLL